MHADVNAEQIETEIKGGTTRLEEVHGLALLKSLSIVKTGLGFGKIKFFL
jgi:hypothetical protein